VKLADVSIRRPVFAVMLIGGLAAMGGVSLPRLGVDLFPRIEFPLVTVATELEGAAPETVEREVTEPLEEAVNTIAGIRSLRSVSSESHSLLLVEFGLEEDASQKAQDVRDKVFAAVGRLPAEAKPPVVDRLDPDAEPILAVLLAGPQPIRELTELAERELRERLERLAGVGSVAVVGGRAREVRVWLDPVRLAGYGLAVDDVLGALAREHVELPGGHIETARRDYTVRTAGRLSRVDQFGRLVVAERDGRVIRLGDVAAVEDGMADERGVAKLDGRRGISLLVRRQSGENIVAVADRVKRELEAVRSRLPRDVEMIVAQDVSRFIRASIRDVAIDVAWGGLLAVLVVLAFLRSARSTLICATAIPTSVVASFALFYFLGFTLNNMTLMALSLSIGMLIDDAIVVLEACFRRVEAGEEARRAASRATGEVGLAVVASTLSIGAVFVPIAFMGSVIGKFFREFGLVVAAATAVSCLVSLTLTPMLCSRYLRASRGAGHGALWHALERGYVGLEARYRRLLALGLARRAAVLAGAAAAIAAGALLASRVPFDFVAPADRSEFEVWMKLALGTPLPRTLAAAEAAEAALRAHPHVTDVFTRAGSDAGARRSNEARLYVKLVPKDARDETQAEIMEAVRGRVRALGLPLADLAVEDIPWIQVAGARQAMLSYAIRGPDHERLGRYAGELAALLERAGGYVDVTSSFEGGRPEIQLEVERGRAADLGVSVERIGRTLGALLGGPAVASFEEGGERYDVRLALRREYRDDPAKLGLVNVRAAGGGMVPLANLARPVLRTGAMQVDRENRARVVTVHANLAGKALGTAAAEIEAFAAGLGLPEGYEIAAVGPAESMAETARAIGFAFLLAMLAMYMILASQFDSFVQPATIMLSAPLSFCGAFAALWAGGYTLGMMSQIGLLVLMGLVMKNGILLVDCAIQLRGRGLSAREAALEAGPARLRPVLMTAVSTVLGMLPVATSRGEGAEFRDAMAVIVIGGMSASTLLTLLVVPVAWTLVEDGKGALARAAARLAAAAQARLARASAVSRSTARSG
jgi:HAE1 family hydrophobic/amphiphilic exporter-1